MAAGIRSDNESKPWLRVRMAAGIRSDIESKPWLSLAASVET